MLFPFPAPAAAARPKDSPVWLTVLAASVGLLAVRSLTLTAAGRPGWLVALGEVVPLLLAAAGVVGGLVFLARDRWAAAGLALAGGVGLAAWAAWLRDYLVGEPGAVSLGVALIAGAIAAVLLVRHGGSLFRIGLAAAFAYLALHATNSLGRLGLVAGFLLSWDLVPWAGRLLPASPRWVGWPARLGLAGLLLAWAFALVTGRASNWLAAYPFGLREQPLTFAHQAARFAGQPAMPDRALVYDLVQACVYVFHAAPGHRVYMDARLEVPSLETFRTYLLIDRRLQAGDPRGMENLRSLGNPVVLLSHEEHARAEALLLTQPGWRLVYFDALAAVFLPRTDPGLENLFPTLDLGQRHFAQPDAPSQPAEPGAAAREAQALYRLAEALPASAADRWTRRVPLLLAALNRAELARQEDPTQVAPWTLRALCHAALVPETGGPPSPSNDGWVAETDLAAARATSCFRRAVERAPDDPGPRANLDRWLTERRLTGARPMEEAAERAVAAGEGGWNWSRADRLAGACLRLGRPALAREIWQRAQAPPSEAVRLSRLADTLWAEEDLDAAESHYRQARRLDSRLSEPCWALAWLHAERGRAADALRACREALALPIADRLRGEMQALEGLLLTVGGQNRGAGL